MSLIRILLRNISPGTWKRFTETIFNLFRSGDAGQNVIEQKDTSKSFVKTRTFAKSSQLMITRRQKIKENSCHALERMVILASTDFKDDNEKQVYDEIYSHISTINHMNNLAVLTAHFNADAFSIYYL